MSSFAWACAACTLVGILQALCGLVVLWRFLRGADAPAPNLPPVTVLKPLCGDEPGLEDALTSFCAQDYPEMQIVFGAHDAADPALAVARRVQARHPACDIAVIADPAQHGANRKIGNLLNMLPAARHDLLVFADSDVCVQPAYLRTVVAALARPGVGLVTTPSVGRATCGSWAARLGVQHITATYLPGVLLGAAMGRQDCLGTTAALHRRTLERLGGLAIVADRLADDAWLGRAVRASGLRVRLAHTLSVVGVPEASFADLWRHELRWACTVRSLLPLLSIGSALQFPIAWAVLAIAVGGTGWWWLAPLAIAARAGTALTICRLVRRHVPAPPPAARPLLLPVRDALSVAELTAAFVTRHVEWRGRRMAVSDSGQAKAAAPRRPGQAREAAVLEGAVTASA